MNKIILIALMMITSLYATKKDVTVSIVPQKYFVEKIAGDKVNVNVMVKQGFSPATYEPRTSQMKKLSTSSVYFAIGVPFEKSWLEKFEHANKSMLIVHTDEGIKKLEMAEHSHHEEEGHDEHAHEKHDEHEEYGHKKHDDHDDHEEHGHEKHDDHEEHGHEKHDDHADEKHDEHEHEGLDPHVWLDPILVKTQALNIYNTLIKIDEANSSFYKTNYENFIKELDTLNEKLAGILKPYEHKAFMVFHPSWGYFANRYSLEQVAIEVEGKEPKPKELVELIKDAKEHKIKIVFVAPQFSQKSAKIIASSINGNVVTIDPLSKDWDKSLINTAVKIADTYK